MHNIQFDPQTELALSRQAALAGKDADQLIRDLVSEFLAEQAVTEEADAAYSRYLAGQEKTVALDELEQRLGLEG